jgi:Flp pilus assembly protein TadD
MSFLRSWLLCLALVAGTAIADEVKEVQRLHAAGQTAEALERARKHIAMSPRNASMRFQLGVMLADSGQPSQAQQVFEQLVQDYPELPEPYNNLAALRAAAGDHEGARSALEQALRVSPTMATAHENMGDVQVMLALRSYARASQLDPGSDTAAAKLALVRQLIQSMPRTPR